jgi:DHA1 family multidrug resistance protein-like MFS transporter
MSVASAPADDESRQYPYWRRNRLVIPIATLVCGLGFNVTWPFVPLMVRELGIRENLETWVGYMLLVFYLVSFAVNPVWGSIADHYGRKLMVLRAMLGMGATMMLVPLAPTPLWFAAALVLVSVFNGFTPAAMSLLVANTPPRRIGSTVAFAQTGGLVGQALGPAAGAALAAYVDPQHALYWIGGGLLLSGGVLVLVHVREVKRPVSGPWRLEWLGSLKTLLAVRGIGPLILLGFLFSVMWHGSITNITVFMLQLLEGRGVDSAGEAWWIGAAAMAGAMCMLVATPVWGRVLDKTGPAKVLLVCGIATVVTHAPLLVLQTPMELVMARAAFGLTSAGMQAAIVYLLRTVSPPGMDARAIAYMSAFQFFGMGMAPFLAGLIGPVMGMRAYFALTMVLMAIGLVLWRRTDQLESRKSKVG